MLLALPVLDPQGNKNLQKSAKNNPAPLCTMFIVKWLKVKVIFARFLKIFVHIIIRKRKFIPLCFVRNGVVIPLGFIRKCMIIPLGFIKNRVVIPLRPASVYAPKTSDGCH